MHARTLAVVLALGIAHAASAQVFSNPTPLTIPDSGPASVYPSTIEVSGMQWVGSVAVVLDGLTHSYAADLDILLVGPGGEGVYIMSDAGGNADFGGVYGFRSDGLPLVTSGEGFAPAIYVPTFTSGDDTFPGASYTYEDSLTAFEGLNANGTWRLYIIDDAPGDSGALLRGWSLIFNSITPTYVPKTFTYQGRLEGANGPVDLKFALHPTQWLPDALSGVLWHWIVSDVQVDEQGHFSVEIPYTPEMIVGRPRYLEVQVSPAGEGDFTTLWPRQPLTMTPMAEWASKAGGVGWNDITDMPPGIQDGDDAGPWAQGASSVYIETENVGIGNGVPQRRLHVSDSTALVAMIDSTSISGTWLTLGNASNGRYFQLGLGGSNNSDTTGALMLRPSSSPSSVPAIGLTILQDGRLGVNTGIPDQTLSVNGNASKSGGGSWAVFSDARLKHDITPLVGSLDKLLAIRGVSFFYNEPEKIGELAGQRTGVVAQEVEKVFPEWVDVGASGYKSVTFRGFEALTIEALRDLRAEKDAQIGALRAERDAQIRALRDENAARAKENAELKARLEKVEAALERTER